MDTAHSTAPDLGAISKRPGTQVTPYPRIWESGTYTLGYASPSGVKWEGHEVKAFVIRLVIRPPLRQHTHVACNVSSSFPFAYVIIMQALTIQNTKGSGRETLDGGRILDHYAVGTVSVCWYRPHNPLLRLAAWVVHCTRRNLPVCGQKYPHNGFAVGQVLQTSAA